jgi:hypothetical protein
MEPTNGNVPTVRADIHMAIVTDASSYTDIGKLMDAVNEAVNAAIKRTHAKARFDFTSFNTHPCKAMQMSALAERGDAPYEISPDPALNF